MKRQSLNIETLDVKRCEMAREELLTGGRALKEPCLRIGEGERGFHWMYESREIIGYLEELFVVE